MLRLFRAPSQVLQVQVQDRGQWFHFSPPSKTSSVSKGCSSSGTSSKSLPSFSGASAPTGSGSVGSVVSSVAAPVAAFVDVPASSCCSQTFA